MKKLLVVLSVFLVLFETVMSIVILQTNLPQGIGRMHKIVDVEEYYYEMDFNYSKYHISTGYITTKKFLTSKIKTEEYSFETANPQLFKKTCVYSKDTTVGDYTFLMTSRVLRIEGKKITCENMDNTRVEFSKSGLSKTLNDSEFGFQVYTGNINLDVISYEASFSIDDNCFIISARVDNSSGIFAEGMLVNVIYTERIPLDGNSVYVPQDSVYEDEELGLCVYKRIVVKKKDCYVKVPVRIIGSYENYYMVEGELVDGNIIIQVD